MMTTKLTFEVQLQHVARKYLPHNLYQILHKSTIVEPKDFCPVDLFGILTRHNFHHHPSFIHPFHVAKSCFPHTENAKKARVQPFF
jgi:hypothetical protein